MPGGFLCGCGRLDGKEAVNIFADVDILSSYTDCSIIHNESNIFYANVIIYFINEIISYI